MPTRLPSLAPMQDVLDQLTKILPDDVAVTYSTDGTHAVFVYADAGVTYVIRVTIDVMTFVVSVVGNSSVATDWKPIDISTLTCDAH